MARVCVCACVCVGRWCILSLLTRWRVCWSGMCARACSLVVGWGLGSLCRHVLPSGHPGPPHPTHAHLRPSGHTLSPSSPACTPAGGDRAAQGAPDAAAREGAQRLRGAASRRQGGVRPAGAAGAWVHGAGCTAACPPLPTLASVRARGFCCKRGSRWFCGKAARPHAQRARRAHRRRCPRPPLVV